MTKKDLVTHVALCNPELSKAKVEQAVHLFFDVIGGYLENHQRVELRGFGVFSVRTRKGHYAHNPQTGEKLFVAQKVVPFFKPSLALKESLKQAFNTNPEPQKRGGFFSFFTR
jgi:integration host factor subunit beta